MPEDTEQERVEEELQKLFRHLIRYATPDYPNWTGELEELFERIVRQHHFSSSAEQERIRGLLERFMYFDRYAWNYREQLDVLFKVIWPNA